MTLITRLGEVRRHVIWICCSLVILEVTRDTSRARQVVVIVQVAVDALPRRHAVPAGQRKSHRIVIELGVQPGVKRMAAFAAR